MSLSIGNGNVSGLYVGSQEATKAYLGSTLIWEKNSRDYSKEYFTIEMLDNGVVGWGASGITYSIDSGATWNVWDSANTYAISAVTGDKILLKGSINGNNAFITSTGRFDVYGNAMSLSYGDNFSGQTGSAPKLQSLFFGNDYLINAENLILPATTAITNCYENMFNGCHNLLTAPKLPALSVQNSAYNSMFLYCTSLQRAPELPATSTQGYAYYCMFNGCRNLNYIKCLLGRISSYNTADWVGGVSATGTFVKDANMNDWGTGNSGIPNGWTVVDA